MGDVSKSRKLKLTSSMKRFKELQEIKKKETSPSNVNMSQNNVSHPIVSSEKILQREFDRDVSKYDDEVSEDGWQKYNYISCEEKTETRNVDEINQLHDNEIACLRTSQKELKSTSILASQEDSLFNSLEGNSDVTDKSGQEIEKNVETLDLVDNLHLNDSLHKVSTSVSTLVDSAKESTKCLDYQKESPSNIDGLKQLSKQINDIEPVYTSISITDIEKRNLDLMEQLQRQRNISEEKCSLVNDLYSKIAILEKKIQENSQNKMVCTLQEEIQCHIQTIGMLVGEKAELTANLCQVESCSKQQSIECEELKARLKASRARVLDLEREINNLKLENSQNNTLLNRNLETINQLEGELNGIKIQKDDLMQEIIEVREMLKNSLRENVILQQQIKALTSKLTFANIMIKQKSDGEPSESHLNSLVEENHKLEKQITELNNSVEVITKDRNESNLYYQQFAQQQNTQLVEISHKMECLQLENKRLSMQEENRIKHINELERQLQILQASQVTTTGSDLELSKKLCNQTLAEKKSIEDNYLKVVNEKKDLMKQLDEKNQSLSQLETLIEQLQGNQPDNSKLLAIIESNKVAATKAVQQNRELKQQVDSMRETLFKMDNDKVQLTEHLHKEMNINKEILEKLKKTEMQIKILKDAIEIKDGEIHKLQLSQQISPSEKQDHQLQNTYTNNFKEASYIITQPNNDMQTLDKHVIKEKENDIYSSTDLARDSDLFCNNIAGQDNNTNVSLPNYRQVVTLDKEIALKYLEDKFRHAMQNMVDLLEEKKNLEHLVTQLQDETETIGEYVTLYQHQRMILKQEAFKKDQQLQQFCNERQQMKIKLKKLICHIEKNIGVTDPNITNEKEYNSGINQDVSTVNIEINREILSFLSDIKLSLYSMDSDAMHCPWCSGQVITV